jgi:formylglycine-generating enzyme required for sulfatase activity
MDTSFLMPPPGVTLQDDSMLDISHESLIRNWSQLNQWARDEAANARQYGRLHQDRQYRDDGQLTWLTGAMLETLTEWRNRDPVNYWWASRYHPEVQPLHDWDAHRDAFERNMAFWEGSRQEADNQEEQRKEAIAREERQKQKTRYRTIIAVLSVVTAVLGLGLALFAFDEQKKAVEAGKVANKQKILADSSARVAAEQRDIARIEKLKADSSAILAFEQKQLAEQKSREAEINLGIAKREEARALVALEQVKKEKSATEEQRRRAEDNYRIAQEKTVEAEKQAEVARQALEKVRLAISEVIQLTIRESDALIKRLEYKWAEEKLREAAKLRVLSDELSDAMLELVFWYCETDSLSLSTDLLMLADSLSDGVLPEAVEWARTDILEGIRRLDSAVYDRLQARYYPRMVFVEGGLFDMGNPESYYFSSYYERPVHRVILSSFKMAVTEVTWWQYYLFCMNSGHKVPKRPNWGAEGDNPVVNVKWYDAVEYCNWLSTNRASDVVYYIDRDKKDPNNLSKFDDSKWTVKVKSDAIGYRLPTESEWEYAARGGNKSKGAIYAGGDTLDLVGWYRGNSGSRTHSVGEKEPNELGLYDMSGNVWEWCWDWYGKYKKNSLENSLGANKGDSRVIRGGSWNEDSFNLRNSNRTYGSSVLNARTGFRIVFQLK